MLLLTACERTPTTVPTDPGKTTVTVISKLPWLITNSGHYRLDSDLTAKPDDFGIAIKTNNVLLDLGGKRLSGSGNMGAAIILDRSISNVTLLNGTIANWPHQAVHALFANNCIFSNLTVISNGLGLGAGVSNTFLHCTVIGSGNTGISGLDRTIVKHCRAEKNREDGFMVGHESVIENSSASGNRRNGIYGIQKAAIDSCESVGNGRSGILCGPSTVITHCTSARNKYEGIEAANGANVSGNVVESNLNNGITVFGHCTVISNKVAGNKRDGIRAAFNCRITDNTCGGNATDGRDTSEIHLILKLNRVDNNQININGTIGIKASESPNQIIRNTVVHGPKTGGVAYDCKKETLPGEVLQRPKAADDPPTANYELKQQ